MARRLVEKGVPYITINYKGWDTHKQHFQIMRRKLPELDRASPRCLTIWHNAVARLDHRVVRWRIWAHAKVQWEPPWNGAQPLRQMFSALIAGGGFRAATSLVLRINAARKWPSDWCILRSHRQHV